MERTIYAAELFLKGYNCAQAVTMAFSDLLELEEAYCAKMASSFGGGMGRLREVCGAVSGMLLVAGLLYGYNSFDDDEKKKAHYTLVQELAGDFRDKVGSIVCRDILKDPPSDPAPSPRTAEYYAQRPCVRMVMLATEIMEDYIAAHPITK